MPCISIVGTRVPFQRCTERKWPARSPRQNWQSLEYASFQAWLEEWILLPTKGALEAGGKTLAFLGSGLDVIYPPENLNLYRKIQNSGAVLSEFPLGRRSGSSNFPHEKPLGCWGFPWGFGYRIRKSWREYDYGKICCGTGQDRFCPAR